MGILTPIQPLVAIVNGLVTMDIYLPINSVSEDREAKLTYSTLPNFPRVTGDLSNMEGNAKDDEDGVLGNQSQGIMIFTMHNEMPIEEGSRLVMTVGPDGHFVVPGARKAWRVKRKTEDRTDRKIRLDPEEGRF